jgi:DNA-directed RNA polymerase specialized sigma24 family protein
MLKYRNSFAGGSNFSGWMYHIARNVLKDQKFGLDSKYDSISAHEEQVAGGTSADDKDDKSTKKTTTVAGLDFKSYKNFFYS